MDDKAIELLARMLEGLQVPLSIPGNMLGTAREPLSLFRAHFGMFGWQDAKEIEACIRRGPRK